MSVSKHIFIAEDEANISDFLKGDWRIAVMK